MAEKDTKGLPSILSWYENLLSRRVDIVGDYAGNELFLIEGDSVLLNCFCDAKIDFDGIYRSYESSTFSGSRHPAN
jgi:hypothetical protein